MIDSYFTGAIARAREELNRAYSFDLHGYLDRLITAANAESKKPPVPFADGQSSHTGRMSMSTGFDDMMMWSPNPLVKRDSK